ncbi:MAG: acyl-[acyl-carrier-protein]--UDP-N-acetylglucosamine O-acyltransferase [SAR324 cluster bacterium]|uniref:Acyl-[acyl-carrier-protein]--UDP-N-acetylglucosamine O-acyltransferase n=1 Tax=SAR324 cluster bacterium TaxID=2024889 RepID=A0A2A4T7W6_9DELT|nr:MAG: acyl-[acyl-carrier-protein]--UDP-N-acetylglucosamine O-acyltransferase [SAR324 cluster bacterium]
MIHPSAIIDPKAQLDSTVIVGPYSFIGAGVEIGPHTEIKHHAVIEGPTKIGANNTIFPFASIGLEPQDKKFHGESSTLEIGDDNTIREYVTINRGTESGGGFTRVGDRNWIMAYCHIAHDCIVGNDVTMSNGATLGGHITIYDFATIGGLTGIHQFCRVGEYSIIGGQSMVTQDVVPYAMVAGNHAKNAGINYIGVERRGFTPAQINEINQAFKIFFKSGLTKNNAIIKLRETFPNQEYIRIFIDFVETSERGVCR